MTKLFILSFNLFLIFSTKIFFGGDVKIVQEMEPSIKPGESTEVELVITKGDREGFAKWTQSLPKGFIATNVDTKGATFSFKNQEIKIIWMALPQEETFRIKYKIETNTTVSGDFNLSGRFSFIEENERRDVTSEVFILTVDENMVAEEMETTNSTTIVASDDENTTTLQETTEIQEKKDSVIAENIETETPSTKDKEEIIPTPTQIISPVVESKNVLEQDGIALNRTINHIENGVYEVTLNLTKGNLNSFGKVEEYLPPFYEVTAMETNNAIFSFDNKVAKFLWMAIPKENNITIKYQLKSLSSELDSNQIHGLFSYLDVDESKQLALKPTSFKNFLAEEPVNTELADEDIEEGVEIESDEDEESLESFADNTSIDNKNETNEEVDLVESITNIPVPETSVNYKVQVAAAHKEVTQQYFIDRHNLRENISIEYIDEWYKYTIGNFDIYKKARDKRNEIWAADNKINDAFVTAYNSGERISVQEALMISKQKWFK